MSKKSSFQVRRDDFLRESLDYVSQLGKEEKDKRPARDGHQSYMLQRNALHMRREPISRRDRIRAEPEFWG